MRYFFILFSFVLLSCQSGYDHKGKTPILQVDNNFLYKEDLQKILPIGLSKEDSTLFVEEYVKKWTEDLLLFEQAERNIPDDAQVQKLVENYRKSLIMHLYQQELIYQSLSDEIPDSELETYYENNKKLFKLDASLIKGLFIKVPLKASNVNKVRQWYRDDSFESVEKLEKYSLRNAVKYEYFYDKWLPLNDILQLLPLKVSSPESYLKRKSHVEIKDTAFYYFLNVTSILSAGEEKPYELAQSDIKEILVNKKQADFIKRVKGDLYQDALESDRIQYINVKDKNKE